MMQNPDESMQVRDNGVSDLHTCYSAKENLHPVPENETPFTTDPELTSCFSSDDLGSLGSEISESPNNHMELPDKDEVCKPIPFFGKGHSCKPLPDKDQVRQILDSLRDCYGGDSAMATEENACGRDISGGLGDSAFAADLKYIEQELAMIADLECLDKKSQAQSDGFWLTKKWKAKSKKPERNDNSLGSQKAQTRPPERIGQGDCIPETLPTSCSRDDLIEQDDGRKQPRPPQWRDSVCTAPKHNELRFRCTASKRCSDQHSIQSSEELRGRNSNAANVSGRGQSVRFSLPFAIPALHPQKWRCRSAPDLSHPPERLEPVRRVSQYDVTISHCFDVKGPNVMIVDSDNGHVSVPSLLWGEDAYRHYQLLTMIERKEKIHTIRSAKAAILKKYTWKQRVLQELVDVAKAYYSDPTFDKRRQWKRLREDIEQNSDHSMTDIRHTLARIPNFMPVFTCFLMMAQVVCQVALSSAGGVAPLGMLSKQEVRRDLQTFLGAETLSRYVIPNPWIGPHPSVLLAAGASFAPCLRRDAYAEEQGLLRGLSRLDNLTFGCCQMRGPLNAAGTTTREECANYTNKAGVWGPPLCSRRAPGSNSVAHVIRPCCTDHRGTCRMLSHQHCTFMGGTFHRHKEHCVEVLCLRDVCTMGTKLFQIDADPDQPWLAKNGTIWQWWRPLLAQFYTFGFLHCLPLLVIEWLLMRPLEESSGWFRVLLIYTTCGLAGQFVGGLADPTIPQLGSTSGVAGVIGEAVVELSQAWKLLEKPGTEAIKLGCFMLVLLLMGLLPYVSLLGSLAGFGCGTICALVFMPYITLDKWGVCRKVLLVGVGLTLLVLVFTSLLHTYIQVQPRTCQACRKLECISFTDNMCNHWDLLG